MISFVSLSAQRYGHLNLGNLISMMPDAVAANDTLEQVQAVMVAEGEKLAAEFRTDAVKFSTDVKNGLLTPKQQQEQEAALTQRQQELGSLDQLIGQVMEQKRNQLLEPILAKAQTAIDEVAKENGFKMVFDTSIFGAVMFAEETEDLMPLVKAKLGITE